MTLNTCRKLDARRRALGMSRAELARRSGVSLPTVNRVLSGKEKRPSTTNVASIAECLRVVVRLGAESDIEELEPSATVIERRARVKASQLVGLVQGTMALEAQAVDDKTLAQMVETTAWRLLAYDSMSIRMATTS